MIIPDANLLIYAYDAASPFHARAKRWWEELLSGPETVGLCPCVLFAFIRISTHARAFENPLSIEDAVSIVEEWLTADKLDLLEFTAEDCHKAMQLLIAAGTGGNLTTDAQIAATAIRFKATVHTADSDFSRLNATWQNPLIS